MKSVKNRLFWILLVISITLSIVGPVLADGAIGG